MNPFGPVPRFNRVVRMRDLRPSAAVDTGGSGGTSAGTTVYLTSDEVISTGSGVTVTILWDGTVQDDGGFWDSGDPGYLRADVAGWYMCWATIQMIGSGGSGARAFFVSDAIGGRDGQMDVFPGRIEINTMAAAFLLDAGDGVRVRVNANGTYSVEDSNADSTAASLFGMVRF